MHVCMLQYEAWNRSRCLNHHTGLSACVFTSAHTRTKNACVCVYVPADVISAKYSSLCANVCVCACAILYISGVLKKYIYVLPFICMYAYSCIYIYITGVYIYIHLYVHSYVCRCMYVTFMYYVLHTYRPNRSIAAGRTGTMIMYVYIHKQYIWCIHTYMSAMHVLVQMYVCMYVCMYVYIHIYASMYKYICFVHIQKDKHAHIHACTHMHTMPSNRSTCARDE
jgi:hypothetical protein